MASGSEADVGLRLRLFGRSEVRRDLRDTQGDLSDTSDEAETLGERALGAAKGLAAMVDEKFERGLRGLRDAAKTAGVGLAKGLAVGVAAAGAAVGAALVASVVKGIEQQDVSRALQATLGLTPDEAAQAGAIAGRIYAQNYGESREQVGSALTTLSNTSGLPVTDQQIQDATRSALNLASAFEVDVSESARAAGVLVRTDLVDTLGEAYALITAGFQNGANAGDDFLDVLTEYGSTFARLGLSGEDAVGLITQAMDAGVSTADFAADALRETGIRVREGAEETTEALQTIGLDAGKIEGAFRKGGSGAADALDQIFTALRTTDDAAVRNAAGAALLGGQYEDIGDALLAMDPSTAAAGLGDVNTAASNLDSALSSGLGPSVDAIKRGFEGLVTEAGAQLVNRFGPDVEGVLDRISGGISTLQDDLPGLASDFATFATTGDLTGLGTRLETAFGLPAGSISDLSAKTEAFVATIRDDVLPVVAAVVSGLTQWAEHKITTVVPILTTVLGFLADHTRAVTEVVYLGLIALGLYKGIMLGVSVVTKAQTIALTLQGLAYKATHSYVYTFIGVKLLELGAWVRSTAATVASTIALGANRAAAGVGYLMTFIGVKGLEFAAWARATAATVASTIAQGAAAAASLAVRGATVAATAAQWLLNAALSANPIGLVVAAIALLVGGLVWFFTKTELGQKAWGALTDGFKAGIAFVRDVAIPAIKVGLAEALQWGIDKFYKIKDAVGGFVDKVKTGVEWVAKLADKLTGGLVGDVLGTFGVELEGRASGGPVAANRPYIVGEEGAELFVPGVTGSIMPSDALSQMLTTPVPTARPTGTPRVDLDDDDAGIPDGMATLSLTIPVVIDGREVARATVNGMHTNAAWE
jgi:hypothetical protein